ncbi:MAG: CHAD domain-containing protein [Actinobacteria bacterium]|nr:CHAD domain-containing protein [Actinomycetota bacterium]
MLGSNVGSCSPTELGTAPGVTNLGTYRKYSWVGSRATMLETEFKLSVHASFMVPDLTELDIPFEMVEGPVLHLRAVYHDTEDLRLARSGVTLRYRSGENEAGWTLKLPVEDGEVSVRDEHWFQGAQATVPEGARDLTIAWVRTAGLVPVARLTTRRKVWFVRDEEGVVVAEIDDDEVSILEGRRVVARFREVELESKGLGIQPLTEIRDLLVDAGAVRAEPIPKAVRALGPRATADADIPRAPSPDPKAPAAQAIKAALIHGVERVIVHDAPTRLGDMEGVHQMRVGTRRLRSDLRTFSSMVEPKWAESLGDELAWLTDLLGSVRDLDVLQERLRDTAGGLEASFSEMFESLAARHAGARARLDDGLRSDRYKQLLELVIQAARDPVLTEVAATPAQDVLPSLVRGAWQKLAKKGRALDRDDADDAFHAARIQAKRVRYAAEAVAAALGKDGKEATNFARLVADVQDTLGTHQDTSVARQVFADFAASHSTDGSLSFDIGRLYERQAFEAEVMKERFFKTWDRLDRKKNLRWMGT